MARRCPITGKGVLSGNNVSHANNKTKRRFLPNLQRVSLMSEALGHSVSLRITTRGLRTIEFHGGLDAYMQKVKKSKLAPELHKLKKAIVARAAAKADKIAA